MIGFRLGIAFLGLAIGAGAGLSAGCGTVVESWQEVDLLDEGDPLAKLSGTHDCNIEAGYELDSFVSNSIRSPELHIIGIYEASGTRSSHDEATIWVRRAATSALVLSAFDPTRWIVRLEAGNSVQQVIATGYRRQEVVIEPPDASVEVTIVTYDDDQDILGVGYSWPTEQERNGECADFFPSDLCEHLGDSWRHFLQNEIEGVEELVANAEARTGRTLTSFHGCYDMSQFTLTETSTAEP